MQHKTDSVFRESMEKQTLERIEYGIFDLGFKCLFLNKKVMEIKNLSKYSNAEKIVLAEQLWDSISKKELEISDELKIELDIRLENLEEGKSELYTWEEVKKHLKSIR
jgi:putative addiction module component (TIGR02574 family)